MALGPKKILFILLIFLSTKIYAQNWSAGFGPSAVKNTGPNLSGNVNFSFPMGEKFSCALSYWAWRGTDSNYTWIDNLMTELKARSESSTPPLFYGNEALVVLP